MCSRQMTLTLTACLALMRLILLAAVPNLLVTNVVAQVRHALCTDPSFSWAFNSLEESPCQIGEQLGKACGDDNFNIPPASQNSNYIGIGATFATECVCNTVYYSLLNVCAACQGAGVSVWQEWNRNCTLAYDARFPRSIPNDTAVPHYAYNALFRNGTFNFAAAIRDTDPEVTSETEPTTTSTSVPSSTSSSQDDGGSSNTGAIAGGVVGGVIGLAILVGGVILFVIRRRLNKSAPNDMPIDEMGAVHPFDLTSSPAPPKTYDPKDPSTFPSSIGHTSVGGDHANGSYGRHSPAFGAQNTYRGVPEL